MAKVSKPDMKGSVCPSCGNAGHLFLTDENGVRRQVLCGASVCQSGRETRIAARVEAGLQTWLAARESRQVYELVLADPKFTARLVGEVMRHLPPDPHQRSRR